MTPRLKIAAIALTGAIAVVVVAIVLVVTGRGTAAVPVPSDVTGEPMPSTSSSTSRPTPTPRPSTASPSPSAATDSEVAKRSPTEAVEAFVDAWLDSSKARDQRLADTATPHLAELLDATDPTQIPDTTRSSEPKQVTLHDYERPETAGEARRYRQSLASGEAVLVDVITDPDRGWIAAAILPA